MRASTISPEHWGQQVGFGSSSFHIEAPNQTNAGSIALDVALTTAFAESGHGGPIPRSPAGAIVWAAYGVHPLWHHHRRGCAAELARAAGARDADGCAMSMIAPNHGLTGKQLA
jgi:hypothetical protein